MNAMQIDAMFEAGSLQFFSFGMSEAESLQFLSFGCFLLVVVLSNEGWSEDGDLFVLLEVLAIKLSYNFLVDQSLLLIVIVVVHELMWLRDFS